MAYVADLSCWDTANTLSFLHDDKTTKEEEINFYSIPFAFTLAPTQQPARFAADLFACNKNIYSPSPLSLHMSSPSSSSSLDKTNNTFNMKKGTTTLGFIFKGGIILAVDSRASMGTLISSQTVKKVIEITDVILGTMAGGAADCSYWERYLSKLCRLFQLRNQKKIPVAAASNILANIFFSWRGYGLCCGTMIAGWNANCEEPELYFVDDKATRLKGNLFSCGSGSTFAYGILDSFYKWDMTEEEAVELGRRAIYHATHRDGGSGGVCRVYHCYRGGWRRVVEGEDVSQLHYKYAAEKGSDGMVM